MRKQILVLIALCCMLLIACQPTLQTTRPQAADHTDVPISKLEQTTRAGTSRATKPKEAPDRTAAQVGLSSVEQENDMLPASSLKHVTSLLAAHNPIFLSYAPRVEAAEGLIEQAKLLPNPELESEIENFGGDADGFSESETSIAVLQPLQLGGKISARTELARREKNVQALEAALLLSEVLTEAKSAYAKLLYAQSALAVSTEQLSLSRELHTAAKRKVAAGAVLALEETKAEIALRNAELAYQSRKAELQVAKESLSSLWRGTPNDISIKLHSDSKLEVAGLLDELELSASPAYKAIAAKERSSAARLELEKTLGVPDARIGLGYKRLEESETNSLLGIVSIDLPAFDRNQGAIKSARESLSVTTLEKKGALLNLERSTRALQSSTRSLLNEYRVLKATILPQAKRGLSQAQSAYSQGRTSYLDLLDAQQTLLEAKLRKASIELQVRENKAHIENISGLSMRQALEVLR